MISNSNRYSQCGLKNATQNLRLFSNLIILRSSFKFLFFLTASNKKYCFLTLKESPTDLKFDLKKLKLNSKLLLKIFRSSSNLQILRSSSIISFFKTTSNQKCCFLTLIDIVKLTSKLLYKNLRSSSNLKILRLSS